MWINYVEIVHYGRVIESNWIDIFNENFTLLVRQQNFLSLISAYDKYGDKIELFAKWNFNDAFINN